MHSRERRRETQKRATEKQSEGDFELRRSSCSMSDSAGAKTSQKQCEVQEGNGDRRVGVSPP